MHTQTIVLNGKTYDAVTGELISKAEVEPNKRSSRKNTELLDPKTVSNKPNTSAAKPVHKPKGSQTLMRAAVKKPQLVNSRPSTSATAGRKQTKIKAAFPAETAKATRIEIKRSAANVNQVRLNRANTVAKSEHIGKFNAPARTSPKKLTTTIEPIAVKTEPKTATSTAPKPPVKSFSIFDKAIHEANHFVDVKEHSRASRRKARQQKTSLAFGLVALLLLVGVATYLNTPSLQIRVAGIQAGVQTASPDYASAGFSYRGVLADSTKRTIGLSSQDNNYQLIETPTNWESHEMIAQISSVYANGTPNYYVIPVDGIPVYRLDNGNATWIKNGIWYQLNGDHSISDSQLTTLVHNS